MKNQDAPVTIRSPLAWLTLALIAMTAARAATPNAPPPDAAGKLSIWAGHWELSIERYETPYSHAGKESGTADCDWMPNKGYMVCDYLSGDSSSAGPVNNLSVFSFSPEQDAYTHLGISKDAKPLWERVTIEGNTWITPLEIPYRGKMIGYRDVYVFLAPDKQMIRHEVSADDGKDWTLIGEAFATKIGS
jgi:hypothetical protein